MYIKLLISWKEVAVCCYINASYMDSPTAVLDITLSDFERLKKGWSYVIFTLGSSVHTTK